VCNMSVGSGKSSNIGEVKVVSFVDRPIKDYFGRPD